MHGGMASAMQSQARKQVVLDFFALISEGRQKEGLVFFAPYCRQHNPYVRGGMDVLFDAMAAARKGMGDYPVPSLEVRSVIADGDMVAAHTELLKSRSKPGQGGLRQVHLFRFGEDDRIVEYWDVTQTIQPDMPNAANAFQ